MRATLINWKGRALEIAFLFMLLSGIVAPVSEAVEYGIASRYVGDQGIENDPSVVFSEDFEGPDLSAVLSGWEYVTHEERMTLCSDAPPVSEAQQSLFMKGSADMYQRLPPGYDQLYIRFYAKFEAGCDCGGHWVWLGGRYPSVPWPWPEAGTCPEGDERWATGVEPMGSSWSWDFYTYWMHMRSAPDGHCWGNTFSGRPSPWPVAKDEWICVEFMVKMNDPVTAYNGEQAFWINGEKMAHLGPGFPSGKWIWDGFYPGIDEDPFEGFQWRKVEGLNINYVWLEHYVPNDPDCGCWFDNLVIATQYIGPIRDARTVYVDPSGVCNGYTPCFSTIQAGVEASVDNTVIRIVEGSYPEHIVIDDAKNLNLDGGWDAGFSRQSSTSTVQSLSIDGSIGTVTVRNLVVQ